MFASARSRQMALAIRRDAFSSPYSQRIRARSASSLYITTSAALLPHFDMRMSSGPSARAPFTTEGGSTRLTSTGGKPFLPSRLRRTDPRRWRYRARAGPTKRRGLSPKAYDSPAVRRCVRPCRSATVRWSTLSLSSNRPGTLWPRDHPPVVTGGTTSRQNVFAVFPVFASMNRSTVTRCGCPVPGGARARINKFTL